MPTIKPGDGARGRALLLLVLAAVVAAVVLLVFVADPFGIGGAVDHEDEAWQAGDLRQEQPGGGAPARDEAGELAGRYGEGDLGAVRVRLLDVTDHQPLTDQPIDLVPRTGGGVSGTSDAHGVGLFQRVAPGRGYRLQIGGEGHAPVSVQGIQVKPGELTDLGDILLGENIVLRGRVVDGTGRPLPGTSVAVYTPHGSIFAEGFIFNMVDQATNFPAPVEKVLTDDDGWFTLVSLRDGNYRLEARHGGYATRYETDVVVSQERPARDMTIVLGEGATVRGKVLDDTGKPVVGARVVALKDMGRRFFGGGNTTLERDVASTDDGGRYEISTLTLGTTYRFGVLAGGYAPVFEITGTELQDHVQEKDFTLVEGGTIQGRVVRKDDGQPVADARVVVAVGQMFGGGRRGGGRNGAGDGGEAAQAGTGRATTGEDGTFRIEGLLPGPVMSGQVKAPGYVTFTASQWTGNGWQDVRPGEVTEVSVELEPGGSVTGKVTDAVSHAPIANADVMIMPRGNPFVAMFTGTGQATTNGEGVYTITGVAPGEYGVVALAAGYAASDASSDETAFSIPEEGGVSTCNVALKAAGRVTGVVKDSKGEPVAGARVRTRAAPEPRSQGGRGGRGGRGGFGGRFSQLLPGGSGADLTDQDGRFVIEDVGSDRRWLVEAEADDYVPSESDAFQVGPGETKKVDVVLVGGGTLEGRVVGDKGGYVKGARIRVGAIPAERLGTGRLSAWEVDRYLDPRVHFSDEDGRFRIDNLEPGIIAVKAEHEGYVTYYKHNLTIHADETYENYMITLTKGDVLEGVVRGADGRPLAGALVAVTRTVPGEDAAPADETDDEIDPQLSGRSEDDGRFRIENVPPGTWNVVVWFAPGHQGWARDRSPKAIRRGVVSSSTNLEFRLDASVSGAGPGFGPGRNRPRGGGGRNGGGGNDGGSNGNR